MWLKLVTYVGPASDWQPRYAFLQRGDGPLVQYQHSQPFLFESVEAAIKWARDAEYSYVVTDHLLLWRS